MSPEQIERLKRDYTDKFVKVTGSRPDHARFVGSVGQVKTVNMNGRALVEFAEHHRDIGWYDIDLDFLKVVTKPTATEPETKAAAKRTVSAPAAKQATGKKLSPLEILRQQGAKRGADAQAAQAPIADKPKVASAKGLSPIEQLRQMGGGKGKTANETEATQPRPATPPVASSNASDPIPPECTPEPLRRAREREFQRGPMKETGHPTTADIFAMAQGTKPLGWKPPAPEDFDKSHSKWAKVRGGKITAHDHTPHTLTTADIWAISKGELRVGPSVVTTPQHPEDVVVDETELPDAAAENKLSTADIIAQLRAKK